MHEPCTLSFGKYLKTIRESNGITLVTVADRVRVSVWLLVQIEAENHDKLPGEVYVKGALKAYAEVLGLDPGYIVKRYEMNRQAYCDRLAAENALINSGRRVALRVAAVLGVLGAAVAISIAVFGWTNHLPAHRSSTRSAVESGNVTEGRYAETIYSSSESVTDLPFRLNDRLHLKLVAISEIEVTLRIDDEKSFAYKLNPNDEIQAEASARFSLTMSNPVGVNVFLNDEPVRFRVVPGYPVSVLLKKKQVGDP